MAKSNLRDEVQLINIPNILAVNRPLLAADSKCSSWVYAAYLPPGNHQFLIYQNGKTPRLFVKSILINLSSTDLKVDVPRQALDAKVEKQLQPAANVWRLFKHDTHQRDEKAFDADLKNFYEPSLFIKDADEEEQCK